MIAYGEGLTLAEPPWNALPQAAVHARSRKSALGRGILQGLIGLCTLGCSRRRMPLVTLIGALAG